MFLADGVITERPLPHEVRPDIELDGDPEEIVDEPEWVPLRARGRGRHGRGRGRA